MRHSIFLILPALVLCAGCQYSFELQSKEEAQKEVLANDPAFSQILAKKNVIDEKTAGLKADYDDKSSQINSQIITLKQELSAFRQKTNTQVSELNAQLDPLRAELRQKIRELTAELKLKSSSLSATKKTVIKYDNMVKQSTASQDLSKEAPQWEDKVAGLKSEADALAAQISDIRNNIRIASMKLKLLK